MKHAVALFLIVGVAAAAIADGPMHSDPFAAEARTIMQEYWDRSPADLTFAEIDELSAALSVPAQKAAYVKKSAFASMMMPGLGQFKNRDPLAGSLFLLGDIAVTAGTAVGLYFLLPDELKADQLDYFNTPYADIRTAWESAYESATLVDSLPFWGVATGGMLLKNVLSHFSGRHAARLAMERIESGDVTFEPRAGIFSDMHGRPGIGFGLSY